MSGSARPPRIKPAPPPPDASCPGKKHRRPNGPDQNEAFYDIQQAASATECTGMLAAQVQTEEEARNVSSLAGIHRIHAPHSEND